MGGSGDDFDPDRTSNFYQHNIMLCHSRPGADEWGLVDYVCVLGS